MAHQPRNRLGLGGIETEARPKLQRDLGADLAMVAAASLGDVVQQHGDIERRARCNLLEKGGRNRVILLELAALDRREQTNGPDRMLIDSIVMVHVELHLRDNAPEVGNKAAEHTRLIHPAEHRFGMIDARSEPP